MKREEYPRISDILGVWTKAFYDAIAPEVLQNAADRGTRVHKSCLCVMQGIWNPLMQEDEKGYLMSFERYHAEKMPRLFVAEERLYCDKLRFSGQLDFLWHEKDSPHLWLVDLKTPASEGIMWKYQVAAYFYLAKIKGYDVGSAKVLKLSKTGGKAKVLLYENVEEDFEVVRQCIELYHKFNPIKETK